jgi:mono/diheme cytochrome c family protein
MKKHFNQMVAVAIVAVAGALAVQSARAADSAAGKTVFSHKCQICHGADGNGNPGMAAALHVTFVPLSSEEIQKMSDADIKKVITEGKGKMRPVSGLSDADVDNVIAFVRTLKKK